MRLSIRRSTRVPVRSQRWRWPVLDRGDRRHVKGEVDQNPAVCSRRGPAAAGTRHANAEPDVRPFQSVRARPASQKPAPPRLERVKARAPRKTRGENSLPSWRAQTVASSNAGRRASAGKQPMCGKRNT
jgi:hypothetical protein